MLAMSVVVAPPTSAAGNLTVTSTTTTRVAPNATTTLSGLSVSGDTVNTLQATLATDLGTLSLTTTTGLTLGYNNSWSGTQSITFTGTQAAINTGLASARITTGATTGTAHVALTTMVAQSGYYYLAANQHFYRYVANSGVTWTQADADARTTVVVGEGRITHVAAGRRTAVPVGADQIRVARVRLRERSVCRIVHVEAARRGRLIDDLAKATPTNESAGSDTGGERNRSNDHNNSSFRVTLLMIRPAT